MIDIVLTFNLDHNHYQNLEVALEIVLLVVFVKFKSISKKKQKQFYIPASKPTKAPRSSQCHHNWFHWHITVIRSHGLKATSKTWYGTLNNWMKYSVVNLYHHVPTVRRYNIIKRSSISDLFWFTNEDGRCSRDFRVFLLCAIKYLLAGVQGNKWFFVVPVGIKWRACCARFDVD